MEITDALGKSFFRISLNIRWSPGTCIYRSNLLNNTTKWGRCHFKSYLIYVFIYLYLLTLLFLFCLNLLKIMNLILEYILKVLLCTGVCQNYTCGFFKSQLSEISVQEYYSNSTLHWILFISFTLLIYAICSKICADI